MRGHSNISAANESLGSQVGSHLRPTRSHAEPPWAFVSDLLSARSVIL